MKEALPWLAIIGLGFTLLYTLPFPFNLAAVIFALIVVWHYPTTDPVQKAKEEAEIAKYRQQVRLADRDISLEAEIQIKLKQAEADIEEAVKLNNAERVLKYTKKKAELEKELRALRG